MLFLDDSESIITTLLCLSFNLSYRNPVGPCKEESLRQCRSHLRQHRTFKGRRQRKLFWGVCSSFWEKRQVVFQKARAQFWQHGVFFWGCWQFLLFLVSADTSWLLPRVTSILLRQKHKFDKKCIILSVFFKRYNFDSWREFSYLDEEEKEKAEW